MERMSRLRRAYIKLYAWASERLYHELAWGYEVIAWLVSFGQWDGWRRQALQHVVGDRVLELGFGPGVLLCAAAEAGLCIVGIDPSPEMHRVAARRLKRRGLHAARLRARAQTLPFVDESFDTVIATFPTSYVFDSDALRSVARVIKHDVGGQSGRLVVSGIGLRSMSSALQRVYAGVLGGGSGDALAVYSTYVEELGFRVAVVDEGHSLIRMPVLILQPSPAIAHRSEEDDDG
jgi:2-polyprenyl-3-methyl-5-hydroxy-6-metoxy-1,4-benzoquinol methylase